MLRYIISLLTLLILSAMAASASVVETSPGRLAEALAACPSPGKELIVKGAIDASDFEAFEGLPIKKLDLSQTRIAELTSFQAAVSGMKYAAADELPQYSFFASEFDEIILPSSLRAIHDGAFANSAISSIAIPEGVMSLGNYAFYNCRNLKEIVLPASVISVGREAFGKCSTLKSADLSSAGIKVLPVRAFADCPNLSKILLPSSVEELQREALLRSGLVSIDLSGVRRIGDYALADSPKLRSVTLNPDSEFGTGILMNCNALSEINGVPSDVPDLFAANCRSVNPSSYIEEIASVGKYSFAGSDVTTLILSSGLSRVGRGAFANSSGLTLIEAAGLRSACPDVDEDAFIGLDTPRIRLHVDSNHEKAWLDHPVWSRFDIFSDTYNEITTPTTDSEIGIMVRDGYLTVFAPEIINSVEVYSLNGLLLASFSPRSPELTEPLDNLPSDNGVIIIRVSAGSSIKTAKIII